MSSFKDRTIADSYDVIVKRAESYSQPGTNIELMTDTNATIVATGLYLEGGGGLNVGIGVADPDTTLEIYKVGTQLKLSGGAADYATFAVAADGHLTIATVDDTDGTEGDIALMPQGNVGIGTAAPGYKLEVNAGGTSIAARFVSSAAAGCQIELSDGGADYGYFGVDTGGPGKVWLGTVGSAHINNLIVTDQGRIGIGVISPNTNFVLESASTPQLGIRRSDAGTSNTMGEIYFGNSTDNYLCGIAGFEDGANDSGGLYFRTEATTGAVANSMTIRSDGKVGIGTTGPEVNLEVASSSGAQINVTHTGTVNDGDVVGTIGFRDPGTATYSYISSTAVDNTGGTLDGSLRLWTQKNNSLTESLSIVSANVGIGAATPAQKLSVIQTGSGGSVGAARITADDDSYASTDGVLSLHCDSTSTTAFNFLKTVSDANGSPDVEHILEGDGTSSQDGGVEWTDTDIAEFFETSDGNAIAPGVTVVLVNGKIRAAQDGENLFGVVRPNKSAMIVGGAAWNKWSGKYLRTPYGAYDLNEDGSRKLNPDFIEDLDEDGNQIYVPRADRDEWQIVGLLGQIPINKGQPVSSSWKKMWKITDDVDMYYVFPSENA